MSIKLRFEKGTLITQVVLKDEALVPLLELVSDYQSDDPVQPGASPPASSIVIQAAEASATAKEWIQRHSASEVLNQLKWPSNPEKIVILGAVQEVASKQESWKSGDIEARFGEARETFPANFPRDIKTAIRDGLVASVTPRSYRVSRTGWNRIKEAIEKLNEPPPVPSL